MGILNKLMIAAVITAVPCAALADTVWIGELGVNPIKTSDVEIGSVQGDSITFTTQSGVNSTKKLSQLQLINVDGETNFNAAENAFIAKDWNDALTNYQTSGQLMAEKKWIRVRSATRLAQVARELNRYDAEVAAYATLVQLDPAAAEAAKPAKPEDNSPYLDNAITSLANVLNNAQLDNSQKSELLSQELDIYRAKKDKANVAQTLQQLISAGGGTPADAALLKIAAANVAYDSKQYTQAVNDIEQNKKIFTEPDQQVDALWVLAQAKDALSSDGTDADARKDVAIAYMRVVTFGSQLTDKPHVPEALAAVAKIELKLNEPKKAAELYQTIIKSYPESSVAAESRAALAKIGK